MQSDSAGPGSVYAAACWDSKLALGQSGVHSSLHQESTTIPSFPQFDGFRKMDPEEARYLPSLNFELPRVRMQPWRSQEEA